MGASESNLMSPKTRALAELSCVTFEPGLKGHLTGSQVTYIQISLSKTHVVVMLTLAFLTSFPVSVSIR